MVKKNNNKLIIGIIIGVLVLGFFMLQNKQVETTNMEPTILSVSDLQKYNSDILFLGDFESCVMGEKEQFAINTFGQALNCFKGIPVQKAISVFYVTRNDNPYRCSLWIQDCINDGGCIFDREYKGIRIYESKQLEQGLKNERWCSGANENVYVSALMSPSESLAKRYIDYYG